MSASQPALFNVQEFTDAGLSLVGGRLYTYVFGTTTQKNAYTDPAGTVPHTYTSDGLGGQYIALDARGELPAPLYLAAGPYDIALKRADGSTVWTRRAEGVDTVSAPLSGPGGSALVGFSQAGPDAIPRTVQDKLRDMVSRNDYATDAAFNAAKANKPSIDAAGFFDAPVNVAPTATTIKAMAAAALLASRNITANAVPSRQAFIEQHISGFFGRGMLTSETINITTEQALAGDFALGVSTLVVTNATNFIVGGCVSVKHDNGRYGTYFVDSKSGNNIGIRPALRYACSAAAARIERTWYNRAHPGKFYMRELAQRIAKSTELDSSMPNGGRVLYTNVSSNPNTLEDTLIAIGGATVTYYPADNIGETGTIASPVRFAPGRSAYVEGITTTSQGVETQYFDVANIASVVVKVVFLAQSSTTSFSIQVFDELDKERGKFIIPTGANDRALQIYTFPADLRGAKRIKVRIASEFYSISGGYFVVGQVDVFQAPESAGKIIDKTAGKIVCLGDSWFSGDTGSTPERESICTQLALELPDATIINSGVGGNKVNDMLARFDTDVAPYAPDYVVINTGTNESYSPLSAIFDPTAINDFLDVYRRLINRISAIGARPIVIGVPALAQSDADMPALAEWQLNDRVKSYARYVFETQGRRPNVKSGSNANGSWTKFDDGTMICRSVVSVTTSAANTLSSALWTYPMPFSAAPTVSTAPSNYSSNQLLATGADGITAATATIRLVSGTSGITVAIACTAVGRLF